MPALSCYMGTGIQAIDAAAHATRTRRCAQSMFVQPSHCVKRPFILHVRPRCRDLPSPPLYAPPRATKHAFSLAARQVQQASGYGKWRKHDAEIKIEEQSRLMPAQEQRFVELYRRLPKFHDVGAARRKSEVTDSNGAICPLFRDDMGAMSAEAQMAAAQRR